LICRCKKFLRLENSRRPNRQMRMAFEFKEEFDRSRNSPFSAIINIDRSTFPESTGTADIAEIYRQQRGGLTAMSLSSDRGSASDRVTASIAGDLPRVSPAIWPAPREVERTRRACGIRTR
jgi:hypothetical protein